MYAPLYLMQIDPLPAIKVNQFAINIFLTKFSAGLLYELFENRYLKVDEYQTGEEDTYQRSEDRSRIRDLADFLINYRSDNLVKPILPATIIINVPDERDITFNDANNTLIIKRGAKLNIVDGQHRAKSLHTAFSQDRQLNFEIPISIITGLERFQEAAQFLIINVKQKQVRTDLTLTVLHELEAHRTTDFVSRLKKVLKVDAWQLEATHIAIALNGERDSPWRNLILRPNEDRAELRRTGRRWIPVRQAAFVDTLRKFCSYEQEGLDTESEIAFLKRLWNELKNKYSEAFDTDTGKNFAMLKGAGVGTIHALTTLLYTLDKEEVSLLSNSLDKLSDEFPLDFWSLQGDGAGKWGTSQKEFSTNAHKIASKIHAPLFSLIDTEKKEEFREQDLVEDEILDLINTLFDPFNFKPISSIQQTLGDNPGCYLLINGTLSRLKAYVGQTTNVQQRMNQHETSRPFKLYSYVQVDPEQLTKIECLMYHLVKPRFRINEIHPPQPECTYCGPNELENF